MNNKLITGLAVILLIAGVVGISGCTDSGTSSNGTSDAAKLNVSNLDVTSEGYGSYKIKATIVPEQDYSYLEMVAIWYDDTGAIIEKSPLVWNINDVKAGETYKATGSAFLSSDQKPAKVDILIFDSVFSGGDESGAIYKTTLEV